MAEAIISQPAAEHTYENRAIKDTWWTMTSPSSEEPVRSSRLDPQRRSKSSFCKTRRWNSQAALANWICYLEMHPVASGQVHGGVLWNTLLRRRLTRSIVLMKWMKGRCGEREYEDAMLSAEKPVKSNCKSLHVHKTANRDLFIFSVCVCVWVGVGGGGGIHTSSRPLVQFA